MTRYRLKRKFYGIIGDTAGELVKGAGRVVKTAGTGLLGTVVGGTLGAMTGLGPLGTIAGATVGKSVIQGVGNAIGKAGESMQK